MIFNQRVIEMNKRQFMTTLSAVVDKLNINRREVIIAGGGASLLWGLRESTNDIDVYVSKDIIDMIKTLPGASYSVLPPCGQVPRCELVDYQGVSFMDNTGVSLYATCGHRNYQLQTKLGLLQYRLALGREKDKGDIKALYSYWHYLSDNIRPKLSDYV